MANSQKEEAESGEKKKSEEEEGQSTNKLFDKIKGYLMFDEAEMKKDVHLSEDAIKLFKDI
jgi:hypothetical protein